MTVYATIEDIALMARPLRNEEEEARASALLSSISSQLRLRAKSAGKDLDEMAEDDDYAALLKAVCVDVVVRALNAPMDQAAMSQMSESALGYSISGTFLNPGGGLFVKKDEYKRLGLAQAQKVRSMPLWGSYEE